MLGNYLQKTGKCGEGNKKEWGMINESFPALCTVFSFENSHMLQRTSDKHPRFASGPLL